MNAKIISGKAVFSSASLSSSQSQFPNATHCAYSMLASRLFLLFRTLRVNCIVVITVTTVTYKEIMSSFTSGTDKAKILLFRILLNIPVV